VEDVIHILRKMYPSFNEGFFRNNCQSQGLPLNKQIKDFSTGMKAKLRVLIALSHRADLLIMDEPTAGLDVQARSDILDLLRQYLVDHDNCSILLTSHISSDLENLCDDIYLIHDGKVILHEDTDKILSNYAILKVDERTYDGLDKSYLLSSKAEPFGYMCFTDEKQFYAENYPGIVIENGNIDDLILMMTGGK
jgi:ABC-2 type transport system ATP-binding protein